MSVSDCNTDTFTSLDGPTTTIGSHQIRSFSASIGSTNASCVFTIRNTGGNFALGIVYVANGSSGVDVHNFNAQGAVTVATNNATSGSVTTSSKDLCVGATLDLTLTAHVYTAGTSTVAWVLRDGSSGVNQDEDFTQAAAGAITATFTYGSLSTDSATGEACFKP